MMRSYDLDVLSHQVECAAEYQILCSPMRLRAKSTNTATNTELRPAKNIYIVVDDIASAVKIEVAEEELYVCALYHNLTEF